MLTLDPSAIWSAAAVGVTVAPAAAFAIFAFGLAAKRAWLGQDVHKPVGYYGRDRRNVRRRLGI